MTKGERIRLVREKSQDKKISMAKFAEILGVTSGAISQWENGQREPSNAILISIGKQFNVNTNWLISGEGEMNAPRTPNDDIADLAAALYDEDPKGFKYKMIMKLAKMDAESISYIKKIVLDLAEGLEGDDLP